MEKLTEKYKKHIWYYIFTLVIQGLSFLLVLYTATDKNLQTIALFFTTGVYIFWSLFHQYIHHGINPKVVVEYVLVGVIGLMFSLFLFSV